jgi:hypothetical protein
MIPFLSSYVIINLDIIAGVSIKKSSDKLLVLWIHILLYCEKITFLFLFMKEQSYIFPVSIKLHFFDPSLTFQIAIFPLECPLNNYNPSEEKVRQFIASAALILCNSIDSLLHI